MKLNAKGQAAYDKWSKLWDYEVAEQEMIAAARNDYSDVEYGWSCTDHLVNSIEDYAEQECMVGELENKSAFYHALEDCSYVKLDDEWAFGVTKREYLWLVAKYYDMEDDEDMMAVINLVA